MLPVSWAPGRSWRAARRSAVASGGSARLTRARAFPRGPMPLDPAPPALQRARGRAEVAVSLRRRRASGSTGSTRRAAPRRSCRAPTARCRKPCSSTPPAASPAATASTGASPPAPAPRSSPPPRPPSASTAPPAAPPAIDTRLELGAGARLDWLPQETILFDGRPPRAPPRGRDGRRRPPDRRSRPSSSAAPPWARRVATGALSDQWRIRRAGRLVHAEALRADGRPRPRHRRRRDPRRRPRPRHPRPRRARRRGPPRRRPRASSPSSRRRHRRRHAPSPAS